MKLFSSSGKRDAVGSSGKAREAVPDRAAAGTPAPVSTSELGHVRPITPPAQPAVSTQPVQAPPAQPEVQAASVVTPVQPPVQNSDLTYYPEESHLSAEQELAIKKAIASKPANHKTRTAHSGEPGFEHLAPPKKSVIKIIFVTLLVLILVGAAGYGGWYFWWTQYATFEYTLQPVVILDGQGVTPDKFLPAGKSEKGITAHFRDSSFTPVPGPMVVPLRLELGLRSLETDAALYVLTPETQRIHEFGDTPYELNPADFITNIQIARGAPYEIAFTETPLALEEYMVGEHTLHLSLNDTPFDVTLIITDTSPPTAVPENVTVKIGEYVTPDLFVTDVFDHSGVDSIAFSGESEGEVSVIAWNDQIMEIAVTDIYGNFEIYAGALTVIKNQYPPVLEGVPHTIECIVGQPVPYPLDILAFDDFGRELEFSIDDTMVDTDVVDEYIAAYIAVDYSGLIRQEFVNIFIIDIDPEDVNRWVDDKLAAIINEDMTQTEIVRAIFDTVRNTISPATEELPTEWTGSVYTAAHYAINNPRGAYYHFCALSELMLTRAGIENYRVERNEAVGIPHLWNLVHIEGEGWYHYDAMQVSNTAAFNWINDTGHKFTQAQADEFSDQMADYNDFKRSGYYNYNKALYPDVVQE